MILFRKLLNDESGYSLPEVIVAMFILAAAIIPMTGMFSSGLKASSTGSNLDKARSLANKQLEQAKNLPYADARDKFPGTTAHAAYNSTGNVSISNQTDAEYANFTYDVVKQYVAPTGSGGTMQFGNVDGVDANPTVAADEKKMVRVTVTVRWNGNNYTTNGIVTE